MSLPGRRLPRVGRGGAGGRRALLLLQRLLFLVRCECSSGRSSQHHLFYGPDEGPQRLNLPPGGTKASGGGDRSGPPTGRALVLNLMRGPGDDYGCVYTEHVTQVHCF